MLVTYTLFPAVSRSGPYCIFPSSPVLESRDAVSHIILETLYAVFPTILETLRGHFRITGHWPHTRSVYVVFFLLFLVLETLNDVSSTVLETLRGHFRITSGTSFGNPL
jgi:hypothetical protein